MYVLFPVNFFLFFQDNGRKENRSLYHPVFWTILAPFYLHLIRIIGTGFKMTLNSIISFLQISIHVVIFSWFWFWLNFFFYGIPDTNRQILFNWSFISDCCCSCGCNSSFICSGRLVLKAFKTFHHRKFFEGFLLLFFPKGNKEYCKQNKYS